MARTIRKQASRFDDDQQFSEGGSKKVRHANNHVTGGIRTINKHDDEFIEDIIFDQFGVRVKNFDLD